MVSYTREPAPIGLGGLVLWVLLTRKIVFNHADKSNIDLLIFIAYYRIGYMALKF